jgi:hypothetical protein
VTGRTRWLALAVALFVLGCGGIPPTPPTQIIDLAHNDFGSFVLLVYDDTGLVQAGAASAEPGPGSADPTVVAHPESTQITLSWTGGACAHGPKLAIKGDAAALTLELDKAPFEFSLVTRDCPAIGLFLAVTLTLTQPVEQGALTLTLLSR